MLACYNIILTPQASWNEIQQLFLKGHMIHTETIIMVKYEYELGGRSKLTQAMHTSCVSIYHYRLCFGQMSQFFGALRYLSRMSSEIPKEGEFPCRLGHLTRSWCRSGQT